MGLRLNMPQLPKFSYAGWTCMNLSTGYIGLSLYYFFFAVVVDVLPLPCLWFFFAWSWHHSEGCSKRDVVHWTDFDRNRSMGKGWKIRIFLYAIWNWKVSNWFEIHTEDILSFNKYENFSNLTHGISQVLILRIRFPQYWLSCFPTEVN